MTMQPSREFKLLGLFVLIGALALATLLPMVPQPLAATDNPAQGAPGYYVVNLHFDSQLTASVADKAQWKAPWPSKLIAIKCSGRAFGGSGGPTYTWTLQEAAGTAATCAPTTAATEVEGTISDADIADEASLTLDYASTGTSPTADDMNVMLIFKRQ